MSYAELENRKVYAVELGYSVTYSSAYSGTYNNYRIGSDGTYWKNWSPARNQKGEWIQVTSDVPRIWTGIITQGRTDTPYWVTSVKVAYSMSGNYWHYVDDGAIFQANSDKTSKVPNYFKTLVYARSIRLYPMTWSSGIGMRFEATFIDLN